MINPDDPWGTFERSAFRLETLREYRVPEEEGQLAQYLSGEPMPVAHNSDWHADIREWARARKKLQRVRVVRPPLTNYVRCEFDWAYPENLRAGEDARVIDGAEADRLGLPSWDYWFFDDQVVFRLNYASDGRFLSGERLMDADPADFCRYREIALAHATVFWTYRALTGT